MSSVELYQNRIAGGSGGRRFDDLVCAEGRISRIRWRSGDWVDAFGFEELIRVGTGTPPPHNMWGGDGGREGSSPGPPDVINDWNYINGFKVRYRGFIEYVELYVWNAARKEQDYTIFFGKDKTGLQEFTHTFPEEGTGTSYKPPKEICGFAGRSATYLDAIGFYIRDHPFGPPS